MKVERLVREAKAKHISDELVRSGSDSRKMWKAMNNAIYGPSAKENCGISKIKKTDGSVTSDPTEIADTMNSFFVNIASQYQSNPMPRIKNSVVNQLIFWKPTYEAETIKIIETLNSNVAPGVDGITVKDLSDIKHIIAPILVLIFNEILHSGMYPKILKTATIIPIHKQGTKEDPNNYRPISLMSTIGKILERIIEYRLLKFIEKTSKIDQNQFGFQKNSCTTSALVQTISKINEHLDKGLYSLAVFIDLRKAFDMVDHKQLLESLEELGVRGTALLLFKTYLTGRLVNMKNGNVISSPLTLLTGVPQGSVLGPLLYILYINNIRKANLCADYTVYADDTSLVYSGKNKDELECKVNNDMAKMFDWLSGNKLVLNSDKTVFLLFKQKNKADIHPSIRIKDIRLTRASTTKYLGIILDDRLSFKLHIDDMCKKVNAITGAIRRCPKLPINIGKLIYNSFILSRIVTNIIVWSICSAYLLDRVEIALCRSLKAIFRFNWFMSREDVHRESFTKSLETIKKIEKCKFAFKIKNKKMKSNIELQTGRQVNPRYPIRSAGNIRTLKGRTDKITKGTINSAITTFNALGDEIKKELNFNKFVNLLKKKL